MNPLAEARSEKDIRTRIFEALQRYGYKQVDIARETGIHHSTLSLWLQGKIKGHYVRVEETMEEWLQNLYANNPKRFSKPLISSSQFQNRSGPSFMRNLQSMDNFSKNFHFNQGGESQPINQYPNYTNNPFGNLIPIRYQAEFEGRRILENILWNYDEQYLTSENFAKILSEENNYPIQIEHDVAYTIKRYISSYKPYEPKEKEALKIINLDLRIDNVLLKDKFEWDINDYNNSPEDFAYQLCQDLGLNSEFASLIAFEIREQIYNYQRQAMDIKIGSKNNIDDYSTMKKSTRSLLEQSTSFANINFSPANQQIVDQNNYLRPITHYYEDFSDNLTEWEPKVEVLDYNDLKKMQKQEDRKNRYVRRNR